MASTFGKGVAVERGGGTQPLPVVETVAAPVDPAETVALTPVPPPGPLPPPPPGPLPPPVRRDRTPLVVGLLAFGALTALVLSILAFAGRDRSAPPPEPAVVDPVETTVPIPVPEFPVPESTAPAAPVASTRTTVRRVTTTAARSTATTRATIATAPAPDRPGKGGGGKDKD